MTTGGDVVVAVVCTTVKLCSIKVFAPIYTEKAEVLQSSFEGFIVPDKMSAQSIVS